MNKFINLIGILFFLVFSISFSIGQNKAEIKTLTGVPTLFINEQSYPPFAYMSYLGESKFYKETTETGVHLYCFSAYLGDRRINAVSEIGSFRSPVG